MGYKTIINGDGTKTLTWEYSNENLYWQRLWWNAWRMMPRHSATVLCKLLGYKVPKCKKLHKNDGKVYYLSNGCNSRIYANYARGSKPKLPKQQQLLKMLGGEHGETVMRAIALQRGIRLK